MLSLLTWPGRRGRLALRKTNVMFLDVQEAPEAPQMEAVELTLMFCAGGPRFEAAEGFSAVILLPRRISPAYLKMWWADPVIVLTTS